MEENSFGYWLRLRRKALDLTQDGLADRVGCSVALIRKMESEERRPSAQIVERLAEIFAIPEKERLAFLRFARGDATSAPHGRAELQWNASTPRTNLPASLTSFIGRGTEIAQIQEYLSKPEIRLVTLMGPPGIGKTRLSIETARACLADFPDGVFFIALAPLDDPNGIASTIVQMLGYLESGDQAPEDHLKASIGQKQMLLVMDNCEHLIEQIASIASSLLSACPRLKILATSRESLRIPGEWIYIVQAFDIPIQSETIHLGNASDYLALMLFVERARAVQPDFKLTAENIQTIAAICASLDGLPLVIELIAARLRLMSPQALLERMSGHFVLTANGMRAPSERQETLQKAIDWSYNLLSDQERKLFTYLSVFSGGFTLAPAEAIFAPAVTEKSVPELVALLLDKSLIRRATGESREDYFEMLVTIREYARQRLQDSGEETEIRNWHLEYFGDLAKQARPHLGGPEQLAWLDRLDLEHDNIRAALRWAQTSGFLAAGLHLATDLQLFWIYRRDRREPCLVLENLLAGTPPPDDLHALARGHVVAGHLQMFLGRYDLAYVHAREAERLCLQLGKAYIADLANARNLIVYTDMDLVHDPARTCKALEENLKLFYEAGDEWHIAHTTFSIAQSLTQLGDLQNARRTFEQSLALFRRCGDSIRVANLTTNLAGVAFEEGKFGEARANCEQALSYYREVRSNLLAVEPLYMLGAIAIREGDTAGAKARYTECLLLDQQIGRKLYLAECLIGFAGIAYAEKRFERAAQLLGAAGTEAETRGVPLDKFDLLESKRLKTVLREGLGEEHFEALTAEGRAMTMELAVAYALEDDGF
jgi:predicted ATPase/DNA-binding XRE family transcriptional regulator